MQTQLSNLSCVQVAIQTLLQESQAITNLANQLKVSEDAANIFNQVIHCLISCKGKVIVCGMGKSGHIGRKIAATLASTGTPSFFVHPAEASHGDLGMIETNDVIILISNSGETSEVIGLLNALKRKDCQLIAITNQVKSTLAVQADYHLNIDVTHEACPHNLAPTTSTTVTLALGDAIAISLLAQKGFTANDFAFSHPGGSLGKRLLTRVIDIMRPLEKIPCILAEHTVYEAILSMTAGKMGMTVIVDNLDEKHVQAVFTDGDLRRLLQSQSASLPSFHQLKIREIIQNKHPPKMILQQAMAIEAVEMMEHHKIQQLLVVESLDSSNLKPKLVGALNMYDLLESKII